MTGIDASASSVTSVVMATTESPLGLAVLTDSLSAASLTKPIQRIPMVVLVIRNSLGDGMLFAVAFQSRPYG